MQSLALRACSTLALLSLALPAAAQGNPLKAFGLDHTPLGGGALTPDPLTGNLVVSNIGSSGQDGVRIAVPSGEGLDSFNLPTPFTPGGKLFYDVYGSDPATGAGGLIGRAEVEEIGGAYEGSVELVGVADITLQCWLDGALVHSETVAGDGPIKKIGQWIKDHVSVHTHTHEDGSKCLCFDWKFGGTAIVTTPGGTVVTVDEFHLVGEPQATPFTQIDALDIRAAGVSGYEIAAERLHAFGTSHEALGAAEFSSATGGGLVVGNIGSSGQDGVRFVAPPGGESTSGEIGAGVLIDLGQLGTGSSGDFLELSGAADDGSPAGLALGSLRQTSSGQDVVLTADFSPLGASTQTLEVYAGGALVGLFPNHSGPIASYSAFSDGGGLIRWWPGSTGSNSEPCCWRFPFPAGTSFTLGGSHAGTQLQGDELRVRAEYGPGQWTFDRVRSASLRAAGLTSFTILGEATPASPFFTTYCVAKTNSLGCAPSISASGIPSASATSGFAVTTTQLRNNKAGLFFYRVNGARVSAPFQCGTLCLGPSGVRRTPSKFAGGNPAPAQDCSGALSLDMNCFAQGLCGGNPSPALAISGNQVHVQTWGRDQGFASPCNTTLSNALEYTIQP